MLEKYKSELERVDRELYSVLQTNSDITNQLIQNLMNQERVILRGTKFYDVEIPTSVAGENLCEMELEILMNERIDERSKRQGNLISMSRSLGKFREMHKTTDEEFSFDASISLREMESTYEKMWEKYRRFMKEDFYS